MILKDNQVKVDFQKAKFYRWQLIARHLFREDWKTLIVLISEQNGFERQPIGF